MSKYIESISSLSDPKMVLARKKQAKIKMASSIKVQASKISRALGGANKYANAVYRKFSNDSVVTENEVDTASKNLAKLYKGLKLTARRSQMHLAKCLQGGFPTNKIIAQLEANYALQAKVAALYIQARTSKLAEDEEVTEEVLPVDDSGYVVDVDEVSDQPESGVVVDDDIEAAEDDEIMSAEDDDMGFDPDVVSRKKSKRRRSAVEDDEIVSADDEDNEVTAEDLDLSDDSLDEVTSSMFTSDIADPSVPEAPDNGVDPVNAGGDEDSVPEDLSIIKEVEARRRKAQNLKRRTASVSSKSGKVSEDRAINSLFADIVNL